MLDLNTTNIYDLKCRVENIDRCIFDALVDVNNLLCDLIPRNRVVCVDGYEIGVDALGVWILELSTHIIYHFNSDDACCVITKINWQDFMEQLQLHYETLLTAKEDCFNFLSELISSLRKDEIVEEEV
jgi:hypothetical protein